MQEFSFSILSTFVHMDPLDGCSLWHREWLADILKTPPADPLQVLPSPYISLPLMNIVRIASGVLQVYDLSPQVESIELLRVYANS
ncbi:hypothetical protein HKD37_01G001344 [Glycine soja]